MKLSSNNFLETLNYQELKELTFEVKETLAVENKKEKRKIFTTADLWNLQRQRRAFYSRRIS
jgi:hypothetical protein